jgi:hypothetical protein
LFRDGFGVVVFIDPQYERFMQHPLTPLLAIIHVFWRLPIPNSVSRSATRYIAGWFSARTSRGRPTRRQQFASLQARPGDAACRHLLADRISVSRALNSLTVIGLGIKSTAPSLVLSARSTGSVREVQTILTASVAAFS